MSPADTERNERQAFRADQVSEITYDDHSSHHEFLLSIDGFRCRWPIRVAVQLDLTDEGS